MGEIGHPHAVGALIGWIGDHDIKIRMAILRALGDIGDPQAIDALLNSALNDNAAQYLGDNSGHPGHYVARCEAVLAINKIGGVKANLVLTQVPIYTLLGVMEYVKKRKPYKFETDLIIKQIDNRKDDLINLLFEKEPTWSSKYIQEIANRMIKEQVLHLKLDTYCFIGCHWFRSQG